MKTSFDLRVLQKYTSSQSFNDLNDFLEKLPERVGTTLLAIGGAAWLFAGAAIVYANMESTKIQEMSAEAYKKEALTPEVPIVTTQPVNKAEIENFAMKLQSRFEPFDIVISTNRAGNIIINGKEGRHYGAFREAIGHIQNGGNGWRVNVVDLCVGRDCTKGRGKGSTAFLSGEFSINKIHVDLPKG